MAKPVFHLRKGGESETEAKRGRTEPPPFPHPVAEDRQDEQRSKRAGQQAGILYLTDMSRSLNSER